MGGRWHSDDRVARAVCDRVGTTRAGSIRRSPGEQPERFVAVASRTRADRAARWMGAALQRRAHREGRMGSAAGPHSVQAGVKDYMVTTKIKDIHELAEELAHVRRGRTVVQCHGVFDLLHIGHIRHFQEAKKSGQILVVSLTPDRYVNKGPHRPVFTETLRAEAIASLDGVDYVTINQWPTAVEAIELIRPNVYAKGADYADAATDHTGGITLERRAVEGVGGTLVFTDEITFSSSTLLNRHMSMFSKEVNDYLAEFRRNFSVDDVTAFITRASSLR